MDRPLLDEFVERARGSQRLDEIDAAAADVLKSFEAAGVRSLLLKGPVLARALYAENEHRSYSDIDLLVAPGDLVDAGEALAALGYRKVGEDRGIDDVAGVVHAELWAQRGESGPLWVDLHRRLEGCRASDEAVWTTMWVGRASLDLNGRRTDVLGTDGLAFHLAVHAAQHGPDVTKGMGDLARGIERWSTEVWRSAARLAQALQGAAAFAAGLRMLPSGARLAHLLALPETNRVDWEIRHREARPRGTFHLEAMANARGLRERMSLLRRSLLPTREWITWEFRWGSRSCFLLLAAYACHILRAPLWTLRAWVFRVRARRQNGGGWRKNSNPSG